MVDMWSHSAHLTRRVQSWIFPAECVLCRAPGEADQDLCGGCRRELPWNSHACPCCALPLPATAARTSCARCQQIPPPFERAWAPFAYDTSIRWLHRRIKFGGRLS